MSRNQQGLYSPTFEHDNCGIGAVVNSKGIKSHQTVERALCIVENLEHRAGKDAEGKTGDGVGILLQISHKFFAKVCKKLNIAIGGEREYGIAQLFFPQDEIKRRQAKKMFEIIAEKEGLELLGYREVPVYPQVLGHKAKECMPHIVQAFIKKPEGVEKGLDFDRKLYIARRVFEQSNDNTYVVSMSSRTIVYKGMFLVGQLRTFLRICRIKIMNLPLPWYIPDSAPIPIQAGREHTPTALWYITGKSILYGATRTKCRPERKIWRLLISKGSCTRFSLW